MVIWSKCFFLSGHLFSYWVCQTTNRRAQHLQHHHPLRNYQLLVSLHRRRPCRPEQGNSGVLDNRRSIVPSWASNNFSQTSALLTFYVFRPVFLRFFVLFPSFFLLLSTSSSSWVFFGGFSLSGFPSFSLLTE